jgi:hypothetical protein
VIVTDLFPLRALSQPVAQSERSKPMVCMKEFVFFVIIAVFI